MNKTERMIEAFAIKWAGTEFRLFPKTTHVRRNPYDGARVTTRGTKIVGPYGEWAIVNRNGRVTFYDGDDGRLVAVNGGWNFEHWAPGHGYFCPDKEA